MSKRRKSWCSRRKQEIRDKLAIQQDGLCYICQSPMVFSEAEHPRYATIDHIFPMARGGNDNFSNLALACKQCNHDKGDALYGTGDT